ncbi:unnamed protein product [Clavelina lepadiformis]|uniref:ZP domain-containing protein n=1 Tax=Clavelina lepadiformis TaxID=159417 RepID=A0ABP0GNC7_CLALP
MNSEGRIFCLTVLAVFFCPILGAGYCTNTASPPNDLTNQTAVLAYVDFQVECKDTGIFITLDSCALLSMGYTNNLTFFNSSGYPHTQYLCQNEQHGTELSFNLSNFSHCAADFTTTDEAISYNFDLRNTKSIPYIDSIISRVPFLRFTFTCQYSLQYNLSLSGRINSEENTINITAGTISTTFSTNFQLYNDSTFSHPYSSNETSSLTIFVPQYIYFEISSTASSQFVLQGINCWATPSSSSSHSTNYYMISNSCPATDSFYADATLVFRNYNSTKLQVAFRSFIWSSGKNSLYLHCQVELCDSSSDSTCYDNPCSSKRRKRRTSTPRKHHIVASFGPIEVTKRETICDKYVGYCSHFCITLPDEEIGCACPTNYVLKPDGRTCTKREPLLSKDDEKAAAQNESDIDFNTKAQLLLYAHEIDIISFYGFLLVIALCLLGIILLLEQRARYARCKAKNGFEF